MIFTHVTVNKELFSKGDLKYHIVKESHKM